MNKQVYLNGQALREPYKYHKTDYAVPYRDMFPSDPVGPVFERALTMLRENVVNGELVVPADCYFAMGDNRDVSSDSRYWGFVPRDNIVGKPVLIYWSYDAPGEALIGWQYSSRSHARHGAPLLYQDALGADVSANPVASRFFGLAQWPPACRILSR